MNTNKIALILFFIGLAFFAEAQYQIQPIAKDIGYYLNPIFAGDHPDPNIMRDGDTYTNSLYKNAGSVWAPDMTKYNGKSNNYFPTSDKNYVVVASSVEGLWSDPVELNVEGIDPGHVADENGKRYLYFNSRGYIKLSDDSLD